jgi:hypothetical protein
MQKIPVVIILVLVLVSSACQAQQPTLVLPLGKGKVAILLDSSDASKAIVYDRRNGFFDKITAGEMSIQMKKNLDPTLSRDTLLREYVQFLGKDVTSFGAGEVKFMTGVLEKMFKTVQSIGGDIFPDTLLLIKTKGRHYGDGVWYTRENCIVIPANELTSSKTNPFTTTMYHELFHIYSRLNPDKSEKLYQLIGFEAIGYNNLDVPTGLAQRILFNPDGVDFAQKISLAQQDTTIKYAVPIIYSNHVGYKTGNNEFFGYLKFNLFQIEKEPSGRWRVLVQEDGYSSTLSMDTQLDFFRQIKDNTGYIIHPDEVLADNFAFIMQELNGAKVSLQFSPAGKQLLLDIKKIIQQ